TGAQAPKGQARTHDVYIPPAIHSRAALKLSPLSNYDTVIVGDPDEVEFPSYTNYVPAYLNTPDPEYILEASCSPRDTSGEDPTTDEEIIAAARKTCDEEWVSESRRPYRPLLLDGTEYRVQDFRVSIDGRESEITVHPRVSRFGKINIPPPDLSPWRRLVKY
ncbi:hypothetical protein OF83DRAFT_1292721, partial [Amylostereum chailletii]